MIRDEATGRQGSVTYRVIDIEKDTPSRAGIRRQLYANDLVDDYVQFPHAFPHNTLYDF